ncbi:LOW QUALITY PROTEIN: hypothetical protein ACHAXA_001226, partial [Cyclostephanos tholiformis]
GTSPTSKLPVMVYIHGGGWGLMGSADPPLWGHHLSGRSVMVISINYRLGIFGFLATDEYGSNGMNGIDDQVNALKWINRYVKYFGGVPSRVTIFGQEVGSVSVCYLSVNPSAFGLFQRGIMQSGECIVQFYFSIEFGGIESNSTILTSIVDRCSVFPKFNPFAVVTDFPTFSPMEYSPIRTPRPTRKPTRKPTLRPTDDPTEYPTFTPTDYVPRTKKLTCKSTHRPTRHPTRHPTRRPTQKPTVAPTQKPIAGITPEPTPLLMPPSTPKPFITPEPVRADVEAESFPVSSPNVRANFEADSSPISAPNS